MNDKSIDAWRSALRCPFFVSVAREVLVERLMVSGYSESPELAPQEYLAFSRGEAVLYVSYEAEPLPGYRLTFFASLANSHEQNALMIPIWFVIPEQEPAREHWNWPFETQDELRTVLIRAFDEVLLQYAFPLLSDLSLFKEELREFEIYARDLAACNAARR
jgi:hypothetical protein